MPISVTQKTALFAQCCRVNTLYMIARAGSGHLGSCFSSMDIISWIHLNELRQESPDGFGWTKNIFFSSKGHDAPALYSNWIGLGKLDFDLIHKLRRIGGLPGHPDVSTPNVVTNTGSLGMGVSKAKGIVLANRLKKIKKSVFVLTGDGELQEGQFWESLISAANQNMHELTVIIDHNKFQSDSKVSAVNDLGDLESKLSAFGWFVDRCDGNSMESIAATMRRLKGVDGQPKIIVADTVKGKGVSFMEHTSMDSDVEFYKFHSGSPSEEAYGLAVGELIKNLNCELSKLNAAPIDLDRVNRSGVAKTANPEKLIDAYSIALVKKAHENSEIVALDADLILDTGLIPFRNEFSDRFFECGIAEQDMVSQAGGMALTGLIPIVHSFGCFLSSRPNEQIYNNASERTKILYVGSLAGVVPGGPGHSHQAVRDVGCLSSIPDLAIMEPSCEQEVGLLLDWAIDEYPLSSYLRLVSLPWPIQYELPIGYRPEYGKGVALTEGDRAVVFASGPIMLSIAVGVAETLKHKNGVKIKVVNLPWLNYICESWLRSVLNITKNCFSLENHYRIGGQGDRLLEAIVNCDIPGATLTRLAVENIPQCGTVDEVLDFHALNATTLEGSVLAKLGVCEK
ncbi:transketolase [Alphaproteobacteria bacterium]|nr:transketolase [Alphaproteobacteria bacterium]